MNSRDWHNLVFFFQNEEIFVQQECIPVGCVPSAAVVVSPGGSASVHAGIPTPLDQAPPQEQTPPSSRPPPRDQAPPGPGTTPGAHPPGADLRQEQIPRKHVPLLWTDRHL